MKSFIDKIKGTFVSTQELFDTFRALQLMSAEDLISFWQVIQFAVETNEETEEKKLRPEDKKKIGYIERIIVENMINLSQGDPFLKKRFYEIVYRRDRKRDPIGISKLFGSSLGDYEEYLSEKLK